MNYREIPESVRFADEIERASREECAGIWQLLVKGDSKTRTERNIPWVIAVTERWGGPPDGWEVERTGEDKIAAIFRRGDEVSEPEGGSYLGDLGLFAEMQEGRFDSKQRSGENLKLALRTEWVLPEEHREGLTIGEFRQELVVKAVEREAREEMGKNLKELFGGEVAKAEDIRVFVREEEGKIVFISYAIISALKKPRRIVGDELNADATSSFRGNPALKSGEDVIPSEERLIRLLVGRAIKPIWSAELKEKFLEKLI